MAKPLASDEVGDLRERVSILALAPTRDAVGGLIPGYQVIATVWAKVAPMSASEQWRRTQLQAEAQWTIKIRNRYDINVSAQMRMTWRGHTFEVVGVTNPDMRRRFLQIACRELVAVPTPRPS